MRPLQLASAVLLAGTLATLAVRALAQSSDLHLDSSTIQGLSGSTLGSDALKNQPKLQPQLQIKVMPNSGAFLKDLADKAELARLRQELENERRWAALKLINVSISALSLLLSEVDPAGWDTSGEDTLREAREHGELMASLTQQICELEKKQLCIKPRVVVKPKPQFEVNKPKGTVHIDIPAPQPSLPGCIPSSVGTACPVQ